MTQATHRPDGGWYLEKGGEVEAPSGHLVVHGGALVAQEPLHLSDVIDGPLAVVRYQHVVGRLRGPLGRRRQRPHDVVQAQVVDVVERELRVRTYSTV